MSDRALVPLVPQQMSGEKFDSADEKINLECAECKKLLQDPVVLPCLHSICRRCLITIYGQHESRGIIACPECCEDFDKPDTGVNGFPENFFLKGLLSVYRAKHSKNIKCKVCELQKKDTFATFKCLNCADFLCEDHGKAHNQTRMTIEHTVEPLADLQGGVRDREMRQLQTIKCPVHEGEAIKYYCETCSTPICRDCQLELHAGHSCASVKESQAPRRRIIGDMLQNIGQKLSVLKKIEDGVDVVVKDIDKREADLIEGIERTTQKLVAQIEKEKTDILLRLKQTMDEQREACSERKEKIQRAYTVIEGNANFCKELVENGKDEEILYLDKHVKRRLLELQAKNMTPLHMKWNPPDVRFRNVFLTVDRIGLFELTLAREFMRRPEPALKFGSRHVAGLHLVRRMNLTVPREDGFECRATGIACLFGDHIVVGDNENRKVKIFTRLGNFVETVTNFKPTGLAVCSDIIAATDQMSLNLYSNDRTIKKKIALESTGSTYPLAGLLNEYLITANTKTATFQVFDLRGERYADIVPAKGCKVRNPMFIATNSKGHIIVSDWLVNSLIIMDQNGNMLKEFKFKPGLGKVGWLPGCVCVDQFDNIFVSDFSRSRIVVLNPQGDLMHEFPTRDHLDRPRCIACDGNGNILVTGKSGYLNVYLCEYA